MGDGLPTEALLDLGTHVAGYNRAEQWRDIERGEYREAVTECEKYVGGQGYWTGRTARSKEACEGLVFEEAEANISCGRGGKLHCSAGNECRGFIFDCRGYRIESVGCEVGATIQHADECEWFRED